METAGGGVAWASISFNNTNKHIWL